MLKSPKVGRGRVIEARCREVCHPLQNGLSHSPAGAGYSPYGQTRRSPSKEAQGPFHSNPQQLPGLRLEAELVRLEDGATAAGECPGERTENEGGSLSWRGGGTLPQRSATVSVHSGRELGLQAPDYAGCQAGWGWL